MILRPGSLLSRGGARQSAYTAAVNLGLTPVLALDPGDAASYSSGQTWFDLTTNDKDFFRGVDGSSSTDDPTFNGTPGALSGEYWSFDGGDFFVKTTANGTFENGLHKDNATWSFAFWYYAKTTGSNAALITTKTGSSGAVGLIIDQLSDDTIRVLISNGSSNLTLHNTTATVTIDAWNYVCVSHTEGGGAAASFVQVNDTVETYNGEVTTPSAADAQSTLSIAVRGNGTGGSEQPNGARLGPVLGFNTNISTADAAAGLKAVIGPRYV